MSKARKRPTSVHRDTASSSSVDFASEEETSSSSAAALTGGRNGKAPRRTARAAPTLPSQEENDVSDGDDEDVPREDVTMREVLQLLQTQSTQLQTQSTQLEALQRRQDTGRSSTRAFLAEVEPSAQHSLSIKLNEADQQHYQNYDVKKQTMAHINEQSHYLTISKIAQRITDDLPGDADPALQDLPDHLADAISLSRSALSAVQDISDRRVDALTVDIQLGVWVDKLGYQFKEVFDRIHANYGRSADQIQTAINEAVSCLRAQADLKKSHDRRSSNKNRNGNNHRGGGRGNGGGGGGGGNAAAPNGP